jgi:hypothetical protein
MRSTRRVILIALALLLALMGSTLPATAHGGGPALYCEEGTLNNCSDTGDVATAQDFFSCEGEAGLFASCTNQTTGETSPYCAFHQNEGGKDHYLCGAGPTQDEGEHHS